MFMNQKHLADNFAMTQWTRLSNTTLFNQVPFGVYAFTEPTEKLPSNDILPHNFEKTVYFGQSGTSYEDYLYDRKSFDPYTKKEYYHRYSLIERRLKSHRHNLLNNNKFLDRETQYYKFYEKFGYGEEVVNKVNVCVLVPQTRIPDVCVASWLTFTESYLLYLYQMKFGQNTLMNVYHSDDCDKIEDSLSYQKLKNQHETNLLEYL